MSHPGYFSGRIPAALLSYLVSIKGKRPTRDQPYCIGYAMGKNKEKLMQMTPQFELRINEFEAMSPPCDVCLRVVNSDSAFGLDYASFLDGLRELGVRDITDRKVYKWLCAVYAEQTAQR